MRPRSWFSDAYRPAVGLPPTSAIVYCIGPSQSRNFQPSSDSQNSRARSKSSARISKCVIPPISLLADRNVDRIPEDVRFGVLLVASIDRERNRQILDGEARRVEDRDLLVPAAPFLCTEEDMAQLGDVLPPDCPCR